MEVFDAPARFYSAGTLPLDELAYWIAFSRVLGIGPVRFKQLLDFFYEDVAAAWHASTEDSPGSSTGGSERSFHAFNLPRLRRKIGSCVGSLRL
jgi:hypothetical protein